MSNTETAEFLATLDAAIAADESRLFQRDLIEETGARLYAVQHGFEVESYWTMETEA